MKIKALVAVREGSKRVKDKNGRLFAGKSLLEIKLEQLKRIEYLDGIVLNSESERYLNVGKKAGVECVKRNPAYATDRVKINEVYEELAKNIDTDVVVFANVTNPLLKDNTLREGIKFFLNHKEEYMSVNSVNVMKKIVVYNGNPLNFNPLNQERSQDLPELLVPNAAFSILTKEIMIRYKCIYSPNAYLFRIDEEEAVDIDTVNDFKYAEYLYKLNLDKIHNTI